MNNQPSAAASFNPLGSGSLKSLNPFGSFNPWAYTNDPKGPFGEKQFERFTREEEERRKREEQLRLQELQGPKGGLGLPGEGAAGEFPISDQAQQKPGMMTGQLDARGLPVSPVPISHTPKQPFQPITPGGSGNLRANRREVEQKKLQGMQGNPFERGGIPPIPENGIPRR